MLGGGRNFCQVRALRSWLEPGSNSKAILEMRTTGSDDELVVCSGADVVHSSSLTGSNTHPEWKNELREVVAEDMSSVCLRELPRTLTRLAWCLIARMSESRLPASQRSTHVLSPLLALRPVTALSDELRTRGQLSGCAASMGRTDGDRRFDDLEVRDLD